MSWASEEASVQVDTYLDELLASRARYVRAADEASAELAHAAAVVRAALVRFHPSFRFEEELAAGLRAVATGAARAAGAGAGAVVRFPAPAALTLAPASHAEAVDPAATDEVPADTGLDLQHPGVAERGWVLVGGAIASGVSLAAGVLLARRRSRGDAHWERLA